MTFAAMQAEVVRRLSQGSRPVFWSSDQLQAALNAGYAELSDASEWLEESVAVPLLADRPYYDLRTVIGCEFLAVGPAYNTTTQRWLTPTAVKQLDGHDRRWERVDGEPQRIVMRGLWWLGYWPRVHQDQGEVLQYFVGLPPALCEDTDEPGFPETYHDGCIDFAMADLWAQDGETKLALTAWESYLKTEADLTLWVNNRASDAHGHGHGASFL